MSFLTMTARSHQSSAGSPLTSSARCSSMISFTRVTSVSYSAVYVGSWYISPGSRVRSITTGVRVRLICSGVVRLAIWIPGHRSEPW